MSDCPHCANLQEVLHSVSASEHELRDQVISLNRALAAAERRESAAKGKLTKEQTAAEEAKVIHACLDVWEEHCWAGKGKPKRVITGERAARVRKALGWEFEPADICDAFRGLALLPYRDKYNERSKVPRPGFKRAADVSEALRDEARLERFRDYYRRVQATPSERLREQWWEALAVADALYELLRTEALWERYTQTAAERIHDEQPSVLVDAAERALRVVLAQDGLLDAVSDTGLRLMARMALSAADDVRFRDECERRPGHWTPPKEPVDTGTRLFVIDGGKAAA